MRDQVSRLLLAVGSVSLAAAVLEAALHFVFPVIDPDPEFGSAGMVLLLARTVYDWLRRRDLARHDLVVRLRGRDIPGQITGWRIDYTPGGRPTVDLEFIPDNPDHAYGVLNPRPNQ